MLAGSSSSARASGPATSQPKQPYQQQRVQSLPGQGKSQGKGPRSSSQAGNTVSAKRKRMAMPDELLKLGCVAADARVCLRPMGGARRGSTCAVSLAVISSMRR
eukprot:6457767-Amphidinium_carterae.1